MPKIQNLPKPSALVGIDFANIKSIWFAMDPTDPASEIRSGVVTERDLDSTPKTLTVNSGGDIFSLEIGYDRIMDAPPAKPAPDPVGEKGPAGTPGETAPVNSMTVPSYPALGSTIRFKTSIGIESGVVQLLDEAKGDVMVRKAGNAKNTRVALTDIVPGAPEPAHETVTPAVEKPAPKQAPMPPTQPPPKQELVVRPAAPLAENVRHENVLGEVFDDPALLQTPRMFIAQGVKDHELLGLTKGGLYLGLGEDPANYVCLAQSTGKPGCRTQPAVEFCVLMMDGYWVEAVPYGEEKKDKTMPIIARTKDELTRFTPKAEFAFETEARLFLLIRKPDGVESEQFRFPIGDSLWAIASFKAARTGFKAVVVPINTRISKFGGGKPPHFWRFGMHSEVIEGEKNIFGKPIVVCKGEWPAEMVSEFETFIPKRG